MSSRTVDSLITTRRDGALLFIGINRPAKRNGFTPQMARDLAAAYTLLEQDDQLRVGVLYAHGGHFTAGLDLPSWAEAMQRGETIWPPGAIDPLDLREPRRSKPVVAAVQGICFTLGIELMLAADIVVAADDCRFAQLEVHRGIMATGGATLRMAERAGMGAAMWCLLTGDHFDAATALRWNFVQQVVPVGELMPRAEAIARRIAEAAPLAVRATRSNVLLAIEQGPAAASAEFVAVQQQLARSEDAAEGVRSFVEKRPPRFSGR